jgi:hypothetical protein
MSATIPEFGGCLWPLDPACLTEAWAVYDEPTQARAHALASTTLHALTARRVGGCPITVRPAPQRGMCFVPFTGGFQPGMNTAGRWVNNCGGFTTGDSFGITLPGPVGRVDEVKVDGAVIDPANYRIDNGRHLVWQGEGESPFPVSQNLNLPDTEPGTFSVTYLNAYPVDSMGAFAAGILAVEFAKACSNSKCRLPSGVRTIVRQGITMEVQPGAFPDGFTGIKEVDTFISLWNPQGRRQQSTVWSPDMAPMRRTTLGG